MHHLVKPVSRTVFAALVAFVFNPNLHADGSDGLLSSYNRAAHQFNRQLDQMILRPLSMVYQRSTPSYLRSRISNFFQNTGMLNTFANDMLQLKFLAAYDDSRRFIVNSTLGIGGLFDVASRFDIPHNSEDLGQTLSVWGLKSGPYVILPIFGPSTLRDSGGVLFAWHISPINLTQPTNTAISLNALEKVEARSRLLAFDNLVAGDHYLFTKNAYQQRREWEISDGKLDPFGSE